MTTSTKSLVRWPLELNSIGLASVLVKSSCSSVWISIFMAKFYRTSLTEDTVFRTKIMNDPLTVLRRRNRPFLSDRNLRFVAEQTDQAKALTVAGPILPQIPQAGTDSIIFLLPISQPVKSGQSKAIVSGFRQV